MTGMRFRQRGLLVLACLFLVFGLPFLIGHAVDDLPHLRISQPNPFRFRGLAIPAAQAIPAKTGEIHQVDVLYVGSFAKVRHETAECGGFQFGLRRGVRVVVRAWCYSCPRG